MDFSKLDYPDSFRGIIDNSERFAVSEALRNLQTSSMNTDAFKALKILSSQPDLSVIAKRLQHSRTIYSNLKINASLSKQQTALKEISSKFQLNSETQKAMQVAFSASRSLPKFKADYLISPMSQLRLGQIRAISESFKSLSRNIHSSELRSIVDRFNELSPAISAIESLENFPVDYIGSYESADDYKNHEDKLQKNDDFVEVSESVIGAISNETDFNSLTDPAKKYLVWFLNTIVFPFLVSLAAAWYIKNTEIAQEELKDASTSEIKAIASGKVKTKFDREYLKSHRVVTADFLKLRQEPSMKGQVITALPKGTLVELIEGSEYFHRSWLLVSVEVDGEIETGWIGRRYTIYFK